MARLAAWWRRSNLVKSVTLKKGKTSRGQIKAIYRREGPHGKAEI